MALADLISGPQGDLLGLGRWWRDDAASAWGAAMLRHESRRPSKVGAAAAASLRSAEGLRPWLEQKRAAGYLGVVSLGHPELFAALGRGPSPSLPQVLPIVPNLQGFMREAVEHGMLGAGIRRALRVGPLALAGLGLRSVGRAGLLAKRDFPTMMRSFVELELADFTRYRPPVVFLQAQMTDLAVAMHNPRMIEAFCEAVKARSGGASAAGLVTYNLVSLIAALKSWGGGGAGAASGSGSGGAANRSGGGAESAIEIAAILTPWDATGRHMRPSPEACAQAAKSAGIPIWADRQGQINPPDAAERQFLSKSGIHGAVRDDLTLWGDGK